MTVRLACSEDMPELLKMSRAFFDESDHGKYTEYDEESMIGALVHLIDNNTIFTDGFNGFIGFMVFPAFYNTKSILAQELFWWVTKEKRGTRLGVELMRAAERQAKELGAKTMIMLSLEYLGKGVDSLYERMGYNRAETSFMRSL